MQSITNFVSKTLKLNESENPGQAKKITIFLLISIGIFIFAGLFYLILFSATSYSKLGKLDDYIKDYKKNNKTEFLEGFNVGLKIMPSYNSEGNIIHMTHAKSKSKKNKSDGDKLMDSYDIDTTILTVEQTKNVFPLLKLQKEYLPVGDSINMCAAMFWSKREVTGYSFMKEVEGFKECTQLSSGKFIWNDEDTSDGVDVPVWDQTAYEVSCSDSSCDSYCKRKYQGAFVDAGDINICYNYKILKRICMVVKYDENKNTFSYDGGCFKGGVAYELEIAEPGKEYSFDDVDITVRDESDPFIYAGKLSNYTYSFGKSWRWVAILLNIILVANVIFLGYTIYLIFKERSQKKSKLIGRENE